MHIHTKYIKVLLCCTLALAVLCSACSSGGTPPPSTNKAATPTPDQPVTRRDLLSGGPLTYVALGASDAVGVGSTQADTEGYVPKLAGRLPQGSHLINLGVSGIRLHEALERELPLAISSSPKLITIWLVANDFVAGITYDNYMRDLNTLLQQLREGTQARIVMGNLPDLTRLPSFARLTPQQKARSLTEIKRWNASIATISARYSVTLVDLFSEGSQLTAHPEYVSGDGFHPSDTGYTQLADSFWKGIHG